MHPALELLQLCARARVCVRVRTCKYTVVYRNTEHGSDPRAAERRNNCVSDRGKEWARGCCLEVGEIDSWLHLSLGELSVLRGT